MIKRRRTPSEKKRFSYERDGVNCYGESDKGLRKAIPRFKAASHRKVRRQGREAITFMVAVDEEKGDAALAEATANGRRPHKRKVPDLPLGLALEARDGVRRNCLSGRNLRAAVLKVRR